MNIVCLYDYISCFICLLDSELHGLQPQPLFKKILVFSLNLWFL
uniref:Uncharacterized protein n=1 Tax=Arundo donax TaxID=35708 RepID=A0A0A9FL20_ARUDO